MFRDRIRIKLGSGAGGNGKVSFGFNHVPSGGTGGGGGDAYVVGDARMNDLSSLSSEKLYAAEDGVHGGLNNLTGAKGADVVVRVPLVTNVYDSSGKLLARVDKANSPIKLLDGGIGGLGNHYFRHKGIRAAEFSQQGKPGKQLDLKLELELQSDVIFIGLPNAGKSSTLNELTNADVKVAPYAFTTTIPHLGRMDEITLMDLPGLIENTAEGKGLGAGFARHTKSAKLIAHFVSLESADPLADYELIRRELAAIDESLVKKPEIILLSKSDLVSSEKSKAIIEQFKAIGKRYLVISNFDYDSLNSLKEVILEALQQVKS